MATQVQIRGASQATQEARTLVQRELDVNTTDGRICVHDGARAGGIRHVNMFDQQNSEFNYASASGTNAITASMRVAPTSYIAGQVFWLKIANTNTGAVTVNINSLGAKTLQKVLSGTLTNLSSGDLISGQTVSIVYDGTNFQLISNSSNKVTTTYTPSIVNGSNGAATISAREIESYSVSGDLVTVTVLLQVDEMAGPDALNSWLTLPFNALVNQNLGQCWNGWSLAIGNGAAVRAAMFDGATNISNHGNMIAEGGTNKAYFKDPDYNLVSFNNVENQWVFASFTYIKA